MEEICYRPVQVGFFYVLFFNASENSKRARSILGFFVLMKNLILRLVFFAYVTVITSDS